MPRGGSRSRSGPSRGSRSPSPSRYTPASVVPPPPRPSQQPGGQGPSYVKQAAAVAGGVAAGNLLSAALIGPRVMIVEENGERKEVMDPCSRELRNFVECARNTNDLRDCEGLNEVLKACRRQYGPAPGSPPSPH